MKWVLCTLMLTMCGCGGATITYEAISTRWCDPQIPSMSHDPLLNGEYPEDQTEFYVEKFNGCQSLSITPLTAEEALELPAVRIRWKCSYEDDNQIKTTYCLEDYHIK